ncbi:sialidase-1-like [Oscarella lobularis]|uniref:sialidase-1-like n=1 Tax=Oscarella lobularis TaxID=121494 RepID=UPI0033143A4A
MLCKCFAFLFVIALVFGQGPKMRDLFIAGEAYPCYREPVLLAHSDGTVLAFTEGRNNTSCSGHRDGYPKYILLKRSSNFGETWQSVQLLWQGNPDYYVCVHDAIKDVYWLMIQESETVLISNSKDRGSSWSKPEPLVIQSTFDFVKPAVGHGIQINSSLCKSSKLGNCPHGRLMVPSVCQGKTNGSSAFYSCVVFSDDSGVHWQLGGHAQRYSREVTLVQTVNNSASLYLNERNMSPTPGHRFISRSFNAGETLEDFGVDNSLVEPVNANWTGLVTSMCRFDDGNQSRIIYSSPLNANKRAVMGVRISYDEGFTWKATKTVDPDFAGYSDVQKLNSTTVAILYEHGKNTFADSIAFLTVGIDWLE